MRRWSLVAVLTAVLWIGAPGIARAGVLSLSGSTLQITLGTLPGLALPQVIDPVPIFVSSANGGFTLPAGVFAATLALPSSLFTGVPLISGISVAGSNATGGFGAGLGLPQGPTKNFGAGGGFGGRMPLAGAALVNVIKLFNISIPLSVVGVTSGAFSIPVGGLSLAVTGTAWTTGVARVTGVTSTSPGTVVFNTVTVAGFDGRVAGGKGAHQGTLVLVTPFRVVTNVAGNLAGFAVATLRFVPEPATFLLLGSGVVALGLLGRRRRR